MTPYRERRERGEYSQTGEKPDSTHSTHLSGLLTGTTAPKEEQKPKTMPKEPKPR